MGPVHSLRLAVSSVPPSSTPHPVSPVPEKEWQSHWDGAPLGWVAQLQPWSLGLCRLFWYKPSGHQMSSKEPGLRGGHSMHLSDVLVAAAPLLWLRRRKKRKGKSRKRRKRKRRSRHSPPEFLTQSLVFLLSTASHPLQPCPLWHRQSKHLDRYFP